MPPPVRAAAAFGVGYRPERDSDRPFLAALYASTRAEELGGLGWPEPMLKAFLDQQFQAQHRHFRIAYPDGEWLIVERSGAPIGRLYLNDTEEALHGIDIALVGECRGSGIGAAIVGDMIDQAHEAGKAVSFYVEKRNSGAARLYRRLGFADVEDHGVYQRMICRPAALRP